MAEFNEENSGTDPYEALAAAMSGNTGGAVTGQEETLESKVEPKVANEATSPEVANEAISPTNVEQVQETELQPTKANAQEMELRPTNAGQAQAWFKVEGLVDKLDIHDLAGLQLAQKENPNNFTDAQHQQVKDLSWKKIQNVANRKDKLDVKDYKGFESLLQNVSATYRMETSQELNTVKSAETRLYRARNGIEDKSLGEKAKDGLDRAKVGSTKVLQQSKTGLKKAFISGLNNIDKGVNKIDNAIDNGFNKIDAGVDKMVGGLNKFGKSVSAYAYNKKEQVKEGVNKVKTGGAKVLQQSKTGLKKAFISGLNNIDKGMDKIDNAIDNGVDKMVGGLNKFGKSVSAYAYKKKEQVKEGVNKVKTGSKKVLQQSKTGLKKAFIAGLNNIDKGMDKIDNAIDNGVDKMIGGLNKFGKSVSAYAYKKKAQTLGFIKDNKLVRGVKKTVKAVKKGYKNTVDFGKNTVKAVKKGYKGTVDFGKKVYNVGKSTVKAFQTGYKRVQESGANIAKSFQKKPTDKEIAIKLASGKLDKLTPEQIAFAYSNLKDINQTRDPHSKEVNALYAIKGFADRKMDAINTDKSLLTVQNAQQAAEWLNISQHVQDTVNHNRVEAKNDRNNNVALALQSYGLDTKMVTATEKQEIASKTDANSDSQEQVAKQEMINTSPENVVQVQKNEQEAETAIEIDRLKSNPKDLESQDKKTVKDLGERSNTTISVPKKEANPEKIIINSEALSAALSGNTETAVNATSSAKINTPVEKPQAPVNTVETPKPQDIAAEDKKILEPLSGRPNDTVATQGLNPDKNITLDKAPEVKLPENTFTATPEMFAAPKTDAKAVASQEGPVATSKGNKKHLTKEQKIARKLFAKTGRGKNSSNGAKGSPTVVRDLNPLVSQKMADSKKHSA